MCRMLRAWHIDVREGSAEEVTCEDKLTEFYRLCDCDVIDIVMRFIEGRQFCFIVDGEGLLKEPDTIRISAIDTDGRPALVGNLLVVAADEEDEGELRGLTDTEVAILRRHTGTYMVTAQNGCDAYNTVAVNGLSYTPPISVWKD